MRNFLKTLQLDTLCKLSKLTFITFLLFNQSLMSQNQVDELKIDRHELKINALYLVLGIAEISYEYILNEESSVGLSALVSIEKDIGIENAGTAYYRFFFGEKYAAGFFAEAFGMISTEDVTEYIGGGGFFQGDYRTVRETNFGLGIAVGGKFLTKKGLSLEVYGGVGRNFTSSSDIEFVPRFGINIGRRF